MEQEKKYFKITPEMEQEIKEHAEKTKRSPFVLLDVDCGKGKTQASLELLARRLRPGETALYLVPRKSLLQSVVNKITKMGLEDRITVMTFQAFSKNIPDIIIKMFAWVVVDECQECILMAPYSARAAEPLKKLSRAFTGEAVLMLTGTDVGIENLMKRAYGVDVLVYRDKKGYADYLQGDTFGFIPNIDTVVDVISRKLQKGEKVLFFSSSIDNIEKIQKQLSEKTLTVVSKYNRDGKRVGGGKRKDVNDLINDEVIPKGFNVVLATKSADVGINIHDEDLTTLIVDELCVATALQEINRKRREVGEKIDLYFLMPNGYRTSKNFSKCKKGLEDLKLYQNNFPEWRKKHANERITENGIIYAVPDENGPGAKLEINYALEQYYIYMVETLKSGGVVAYRNAVERALGWSGVKMLNAGTKTLEELVGVVLATKAEKKLLIELFKEMGNYKSAKYLNAVLAALELPYRILTKQHKELKRKDGKRRECRSGWMLVRTDDAGNVNKEKK